VIQETEEDSPPRERTLPVSPSIRHLFDYHAQQHNNEIKDKKTIRDNGIYDNATSISPSSTLTPSLSYSRRSANISISSQLYSIPSTAYHAISRSTTAPIRKRNKRKKEEERMAEHSRFKSSQTPSLSLSSTSSSSFTHSFQNTSCTTGTVSYTESNSIVTTPRSHTFSIVTPSRPCTSIFSPSSLTTLSSHSSAPSTHNDNSSNNSSNSSSSTSVESTKQHYTRIYKGMECT